MSGYNWIKILNLVSLNQGDPNSYSNPKYLTLGEMSAPLTETLK